MKAVIAMKPGRGGLHQAVTDLRSTGRTGHWTTKHKLTRARHFGPDSIHLNNVTWDKSSSTFQGSRFQVWLLRRTKKYKSWHHKLESCVCSNTKVQFDRMWDRFGWFFHVSTNWDFPFFLKKSCALQISEQISHQQTSGNTVTLAALEFVQQ